MVAALLHKVDISSEPVQALNKENLVTAIKAAKAIDSCFRRSVKAGTRCPF